MKTLMELQEILGSRIDVTLREDLSAEDRANENAQTALVIGLSKQMINNADIILRHEKLKAKCKDLSDSKMDEIIG